MLTELRPRSRGWNLVAIVLTIAAGLFSRRWPGSLPACLGKYPGDVLWALMVFFGWGFAFPAASRVRIFTLTGASSATVEFLKLVHIPWLVSLRQSTVGHLIFGHVFSWQNLVAYSVGAALGWLIEWRIRDQALEGGAH